MFRSDTKNGCEADYPGPLLFTQYRMAEIHNPERATSMRSCHGVFTDQFIFRTVLARILNIF